MDIKWYKFSVTKENAFVLDSSYFPQLHTANIHLFMQLGYTWEIHQNLDKNNAIYYLKSNHRGIIQILLNEVPGGELLLFEPDLSGFVCYYGGSDGKSSRNV